MHLKHATAGSNSPAALTRRPSVGGQIIHGRPAPAEAPNLQQSDTGVAAPRRSSLPPQVQPPRRRLYAIVRGGTWENAQPQPRAQQWAYAQRCGLAGAPAGWAAVSISGAAGHWSAVPRTCGPKHRDANASLSNQRQGPGESARAVHRSPGTPTGKGRSSQTLRDFPSTTTLDIHTASPRCCLNSANASPRSCRCGTTMVSHAASCRHARHKHGAPALAAHPTPSACPPSVVLRGRRRTQWQHTATRSSTQHQGARQAQLGRGCCLALKFTVRLSMQNACHVERLPAAPALVAVPRGLGCCQGRRRARRGSPAGPTAGTAPPACTSARRPHLQRRTSEGARRGALGFRRCTLLPLQVKMLAEGREILQVATAL